MSKKIQAALATLINFIAYGDEYPDAFSKAVYIHALSDSQADKLAEAYDSN